VGNSLIRFEEVKHTYKMVHAPLMPGKVIRLHAGFPATMLIREISAAFARCVQRAHANKESGWPLRKRECYRAQLPPSFNRNPQQRPSAYFGALDSESSHLCRRHVVE